MRTESPPPSRLRSYLELVRPPNVATSLADVLAGFAVAGQAAWTTLPWLLVATACLYAGGITLNDVFDRAIDRRERPERPIPSGRVPTSHAVSLGVGLLAVGVGAASRAGHATLVVAVVIVGLVLLYDGLAKRHAVSGPLVMGSCRGANLLLGVSVNPAALPGAWPLALLVTAYIAAVTLVSRGEVAGGRQAPATWALVAHAAVLGGLTVLSLQAPTIGGRGVGLVLTTMLAARLLPAFWAVRRSPTPAAVRKAVVAGVLSLVLVDAVIAAAYAGMIYCLALLATAILAGRLARAFAVT